MLDPVAMPLDHLEGDLKEISDFTAQVLAQSGVAHATILGAQIAIRLCQEFGGARYYWPKGERFEAATRRLMIRAEHDGTVNGPCGIRALARKHRITDDHVWRILRT